MKRYFSLFLIITFMTFLGSSFSTNVSAATSIDSDIELLDNGCYIETIITDVPSTNSSISTLATTKTITKTKTTYYKNSSGTVLWSVSITATFTYNGTTSKCTSCSHSASAPAASWSIKSCTSSKSGNSATAKAVAVHSNAGASQSFTKSVTIKCSANGTVS